MHMQINVDFWQIDWVDYLQSLYAVANISITSDERVIVLEPEYLRNLVQLLDSTAPRTIGKGNL